MTFSIVIPTYNGASFVDMALQSALNQTRKADEIIVSDDNSTDATLAICEKYRGQITIHRNDNGPSGFVNGWNRAINMATTDYVSILHQDDLLHPCFLESAENALRENPDIKHLFAPCNYIDGNNAIIWQPDYCDGSIKHYTGSEYIRAYQTVGHPHIHRCPGVVTYRDLFKICPYRSEAGHIADDDFFYRVGQYTDIIGILTPLASYRLHEKSETGHLKNTDLIDRLAHDYLYQLNQWETSSYMEADNFDYFRRWALHFAFEEYYYGMRSHNRALSKKGKDHMQLLMKKGYSFPLKKQIFYLLTSLFV